MKAEPFISVIVPSYNRADLIAKTIISLQKQTYNNYEIIVVDDGSTDGTEDVIKEIADNRTFYVRKENGERAVARNFGAKLAKGEYVNFFDSDDIALSNHLQEAADLINRLTRPEWFHLAYSWATPEETVFKNVNHFRGETLNDLISNGNPLSCNGVFIRTDIILKHRFNEDRALSASEDYELWVRLAARYPLHYSNTITSWIIDHEMRSVRRINGEKLISRLQLLVSYLQKDEQVRQYYGSDFKKIKADSYSYIALHLANDPTFKVRSVQYLLNSFFIYPPIATSKRFSATLKNLLIKWQKF